MVTGQDLGVEYQKIIITAAAERKATGYRNIVSRKALSAFRITCSITGSPRKQDESVANRQRSKVPSRKQVRLALVIIIGEFSVWAYFLGCPNWLLKAR